MKKLRVGILGATGMVGQRFVSLLAKHPWFEITVLAASPRSAGKTYKAAVAGRWAMDTPIPPAVADLEVRAVEADLSSIASAVDLVFCALDMDKEAIKKLEIAYAAAGVPVISNNSAHRWTPDVPILMPEVNPQHLKLIDFQRQKRGFRKGLIAVKPNCSIQSYVFILSALGQFEPTEVAVTSLQAISGAGQTFQSWPQMVDNVIPYIDGEEAKSETEPLKIWGKVHKGTIRPATSPAISATCMRVPVTDGHLTDVRVNFRKKTSRPAILKALADFGNPLAPLGLPSSPKKLIHYLAAEDRPQTKLDRDIEAGMAIAMGRLREDKHFDWRFIALSHNTLRGAAGGAVLMAELLFKKGYL